MIKAIIVEDEIQSREAMRSMLENFVDGVEVCAEAADVPEAVKAINKHKPDVVFLDIEMPGYTGFQLLDFFEKVDFEIVFTTAYQEYAIRAFQVSAIDYLLKPIEISQLAKAIDKVRRSGGNSRMNDRIEALKSNMDKDNFQRIALPVAEGMMFVEPEEIIYLKADGSYTHIYLASQKAPLTISRRLSQFDYLLAMPGFYRPHRSFLVNMRHARQYNRTDGGVLVMDNNDAVSVAREKREEFLEMVGRFLG